MIPLNASSVRLLEIHSDDVPYLAAGESVIHVNAIILLVMDAEPKPQFKRDKVGPI